MSFHQLDGGMDYAPEMASYLGECDLADDCPICHGEGQYVTGEGALAHLVACPKRECRQARSERVQREWDES